MKVWLPEVPSKVTEVWAIPIEARLRKVKGVMRDFMAEDG